MTELWLPVAGMKNLRAVSLRARLPEHVWVGSHGLDRQWYPILKQQGKTLKKNPASVTSEREAVKGYTCVLESQKETTKDLVEGIMAEIFQI